MKMHGPGEFSIVDKQEGFSIVEMLVALMLGSVLLLGLFQIMDANQRAANLQQNLSRLQESARFAFHFLTREMRVAGYRGCARDAFFSNFINQSNAFEYDMALPFQGFLAQDEQWIPELPNHLASRPILPESDVLVVRNILESSTYDLTVLGRLENSAQIYTQQPDNNIQSGDFLLVTDCINAATWQVTDKTSSFIEISDVDSVQPGNQILPGDSLAPIFTRGSRISRIATTAYYVATGVSGQPALFRLTGNGPAQELVEGVEQLRFFYGLDTNGDGRVNDYRPATETMDWRQVMTIRLAMVIRSQDDNLIDEPQQYFLAGQGIQANDRRLRILVNTTVALRNRLP